MSIFQKDNTKIDQTQIVTDCMATSHPDLYRTERLWDVLEYTAFPKTLHTDISLDRILLC